MASLKNTCHVFCLTLRSRTLCWLHCWLLYIYWPSKECIFINCVLLLYSLPFEDNIVWFGFACVKMHMRCGEELQRLKKLTGGGWMLVQFFRPHFNLLIQERYLWSRHSFSFSPHCYYILQQMFPKLMERTMQALAPAQSDFVFIITWERSVNGLFCHLPRKLHDWTVWFKGDSPQHFLTNFLMCSTPPSRGYGLHCVYTPNYVGPTQFLLSKVKPKSWPMI